MMSSPLQRHCEPRIVLLARSSPGSAQGAGTPL